MKNLKRKSIRSLKTPSEVAKDAASFVKSEQGTQGTKDMRDQWYKMQGSVERSIKIQVKIPELIKILEGIFYDVPKSARFKRCNCID